MPKQYNYTKKAEVAAESVDNVTCPTHQQIQFRNVCAEQISNVIVERLREYNITLINATQDSSLTAGHRRWSIS